MIWTNNGEIIHHYNGVGLMITGLISESEVIRVTPYFLNLKNLHYVRFRINSRSKQIKIPYAGTSSETSGPGIYVGW